MAKPHILVLGAGFAGATFCKKIDTSRYDVTLVDRQNHHLFQPLLYQVASSGLAVPEIAQPIRMMLSRKRGLKILMDEAKSINLDQNLVEFSNRKIEYDYLVIGLGAVTSYFGHPEWERYAPGLKSIKDATTIRRNILYAYEKAEGETNPEKRRELMTTVVIGGGPTGVELAGAFIELAQHVLARDYTEINPAEAKVILIEAGPKLLGHMHPKLSESALRQLEGMGVDVRLNTMVQDIRHHEVVLKDMAIKAGNIIWGAGVAANPITNSLSIKVDRGGRIPVLPDLSLPGFPNAFALGDVVSLVDPKGQKVPGVSPAAIQMGQFTAKLFNNDDIKETLEERPEYVYWDKGMMATIGRSKAVAQSGKLRFSGFPAWLAWLFIHLLFLVGFRNKAFVLAQWIYHYFTYRRGARIIHSSEDLDNANGKEMEEPKPKD